MARLTGNTLKGVWAGMPVCWDANNRFDEATYRRNIERVIAFKPHGIYTSGSTGEFFALDFDEFKTMVDAQAELCGAARMPLQIGCCSDATHKTIRLMEYAASKKAVGGAQVVLPYWMELRDPEVLQFFKDLRKAVPDLPFIHYNIDRTKRFLTGPQYRKLLDAGINIVGVKFGAAGRNFSALQRAVVMTPEISYFVGEEMLASGMLIGARGSYSSLCFTDPALMLNLYKTAASGKWAEAVRLQRLMATFCDDWEALGEKLGQGMIDPVGDKALGVASGCLLGHQRCRAPYIGWSDKAMSAFRNWLRAEYPQFLHPSLRKGRASKGK